jgi:hypothetical protein
MITDKRRSTMERFRSTIFRGQVHAKCKELRISFGHMVYREQLLHGSPTLRNKMWSPDKERKSPRTGSSARG